MSILKQAEAGVPVSELCFELWHKTYIDGDYTQYA